MRERSCRSRHTGTKNRRAFFVLRPPDTLPVSLPGILLSFLALPCNSFAKRPVLIERPEIKRLPRHRWRNSIDRTNLDILHPFAKGAPLSKVSRRPSVPSASRSSTICEVTLRACPQPRGISLRSWFQGWISVPLERTRTKEDRSRVLEAIEGHFAPPKPLRFATALRLLRAGICGVKFWVYKEPALNFKPVALK